MEKQGYEKDLFVDESFTTSKDFTINGNVYKFTAKEISGFDTDKIAQKAMKLDSRTGEVNIEQADANVHLIVQALVEAPFPVNFQNVKKLKKSVREELLTWIRSMNEPESSEELEKK